MEEIDIEIGTGRDKVLGIEENEDVVVINYSSNSQIRPITVSREIIDFVGEVIDSMVVGERYTSLYIYNKYIKQFNVKSEIIKNRMEIIKNVLRSRNLPELTISNIMQELENDDNFSLMTYNEMIGSREIKNSHYFKCYGAVRYWKHKGIIDYNSKGSIYRLI